MHAHESRTGTFSSPDINRSPGLRGTDQADGATLRDVRPFSPSTLAGRRPRLGNNAIRAVLQRSPHDRDISGGQLGSVRGFSVHDVLRSPGRPLEEPVRTEMEQRLGADFSDVRVHTDAAAHASAQAVGAHAFTSGVHLVFQRGGYDGRSTAGKEVLAHELTHVVQQRQGPVTGSAVGGGPPVSDPGDAFERAAAATARQAVARPLHATPADHLPAIPQTHDQPNSVIQRLVLRADSAAQLRDNAEAAYQSAEVRSSVETIRQLTGSAVADLADLSEGALKGLTTGEVIYIVGHGSAKMLDLYAPEELAVHLIKAGLPGESVIKLVACNVGRSAEESKPDETYVKAFTEALRVKLPQGFQGEVEAPVAATFVGPGRDFAIGSEGRRAQE